MFVDEPSSFGIENTFRYMCDRIRMTNKKKLTLTRLGKDNKKENNELEASRQKQTIQNKTMQDYSTIHDR